jgi:hypothetical protein
VIVATVEADAVIVGEAVAEFELEVVAEDEAVAEEVTVTVSLGVTVTELERVTVPEEDGDREGIAEEEIVPDELADLDNDELLVDVAEGVVVGLGDRVGKILGGSEDVVDGEDETVIVATVEADAVIVGEAVAEFELEVVAEDEAVAEEVTVTVSLGVTVTELERETVTEDDGDREGIAEEETVAEELIDPDGDDVNVDVTEGVVVGLGDRVGKALGGSEDVVDGEDETVIVATVEADAVIVGEAVAEFELEVVAEDEAVAEEEEVGVELLETEIVGQLEAVGDGDGDGVLDETIGRERVSISIDNNDRL